MMKHLKLVLVAMLALCIALPGFAVADTLKDIQDRGVLRVGTDPGYMPFEMADKKGQVIGFDIDLAKRVANAMGVKLEVVKMSFDGLIPGLLTDKFDIIMAGMTLTPERNLKVNFAQPYIVVGQSILIHKSIAGEVKSYRDLNNEKYTVASKLGTTGEQATKRMISKAKYLAFETEQEGLQDLLGGKIDAFVYDLPLLAIANAEKNNGNMVFLDEPFTYEPLAWAIRPNNHNMINWLNNFMNQIKSDGTYDKIYAKWFLDDKWLKRVQ